MIEARRGISLCWKSGIWGIPRRCAPRNDDCWFYLQAARRLDSPSSKTSQLGRSMRYRVLAPLGPKGNFTFLLGVFPSSLWQASCDLTCRGFHTWQWYDPRRYIGVRLDGNRFTEALGMMKALKILGIVVGLLLVLLLIVGFALFSGLQGAGAGPSLGAGVEAVPGFSAVYILDAGNGQFALVDTGSDAKGAALLSALQARQASPDSVAAIFMTHAHTDHDAAIALFPKATVYAMKREVPIAAGQEPFNGPIFKLFGGRNTIPFTINHPLDDGEKVTVGNLEVTAFAVPGHTEGSGAYLVNGVLFVGDELQITSKQQVIGPSAVFSTDRAQGEASLKHLGQELQPRAAEVKFIATGHTGTAAGLQPLLAFGGS